MADLANSVGKITFKKILFKNPKFMAYLPTQPMFIGGAAKSPFCGHHPGKLDEEAGT